MVTRVNVPLALRMVVVEPACRSDNIAHHSVGKNCPRSILPCPSQASGLASSGDRAVDEGVASVPGGALPCLSGDNSQAFITEYMELSIKVEGCPGAKDVVHGALNVAILEGALKSQELAIVEGGFVSGDAQCHSLCSQSLPVWPWQRVLQTTKSKAKDPNKLMV